MRDQPSLDVTLTWTIRGLVLAQICGALAAAFWWMPSESAGLYSWMFALQALSHPRLLLAHGEFLAVNLLAALPAAILVGWRQKRRLRGEAV
ncbi:MAG TPA: hypothetical protein VGG48_01695 [Rhizomicrobium sp.]|jgi:hypothetical protein